MAKALITGISGQDGSYLAELLLSKGYEVHGLLRRGSGEPNNHKHLKDVILHYGDLCTDNHLCYLINDLRPDECYNLAAQSDVGISFHCPEYTGDASGLGVLRILEAINHFSPRTKFYQASTSELFGNCPAPQNEQTPFNPQSPYAVAKAYGYYITRLYRVSYGLYTCNGILFNHESPRRGLNFVTRKVTNGVARIINKQMDKLYMGNLDPVRDWGYAPDYVEAMWRMLQQPTPDDFVIGTGQVHSIRQLLYEAFSAVGLNWKDYVVIDPKFVRPLDVHFLKADITRAKEILGWQPTVQFKELINIMLESDLKEVRELAKV